MDYIRNMIGYPKARGKVVRGKVARGKVAPGECINILLLGETGVGKSTFINSFVNYCSYQDFDNALTKKPRWVIPTKFSFFDNKMKEHAISIGTKKKDKNEFLEQGKSSTQGTKSYVFQMKDFNLRIFDTPGMGDTRGIDQDKENVDNILDYLGSYEKLHAIMILLKPNQNKLTVWFEYCIQQLLSQLDKTAAKNLVFVFTYSRSTLYRPGESAVLLREFINKIKSKPPHVDIPFSMKNIFCLDNEAYRFFLAYKDSVEFTDSEIRAYAGSWDHSVNEIARLLKYVSGDHLDAPLIPHLIQNTLSVNEARRSIHMLLKPLADTTNLINDNKRVLKKRAEELKEYQETNVELSAKLYVPFINLRTIKLEAPTTVCASNTCVTNLMIGKVPFKEYNRRCHYPCQLKNVPRDIIGAKELCNCAAMKEGTCQICNCHFTSHMHIYYMTERYRDKTKDALVEAQLRNITSDAERCEALLEMMEQRDQELDKEHKTIMTYSARFAHFLTNNCIVPINDAYETYITHLKNMEREQSDANLELIQRYDESLRMYNEEKSILEIAQKAGDSNYHEISPKEIFGFVEGLFELKYTGKLIKMLYDEQKKQITAECRNEEYVCEIFDTVHNETTDSNDIPENLQHEMEPAAQREENNGITTGQYLSEPSEAGTSNLNIMEPNINNGVEIVDEFSELSLKSEKGLNNLQLQVDNGNEIVEEIPDVHNNVQSADHREDNSWDIINQSLSEPSEADISNLNTVQPQINDGDEIVEEIADESFETDSDDGEASENSIKNQKDYISVPIEFYNKIDIIKLNEVKEKSGLKKIKFAKITSCEVRILNLISNLAKSLDTTNNSQNHKAIVSVPYEVGAKLIGNDGYIIKNIVIALKLQEIKVFEQSDTNTEVDFVIIGKKDNVDKAEEILKNHDLYALLGNFKLPKVPSKIDHNSFTHFRTEMYFNIYLQGDVAAIKTAKDSISRIFYFVENIYISENIDLGRNDSNLKAASEIPNVYKVVIDNNTLQIIASKEEAIVKVKKMFLVEKRMFQMSKEAYAELLAKKELIIDQFNCVLDQVTTAPDSLVLIISGTQKCLETVKAIIDALNKRNG